MSICKELEETIKIIPFFNCVGGCGVDLSNGTENCMGSHGVWFKYCPFCGKKIISKSTESGWTWYEEGEA